MCRSRMDKGKHMLGVLGDAKENYQRFLEKKKGVTEGNPRP